MQELKKTDSFINLAGVTVQTGMHKKRKTMPPARARKEMCGITEKVIWQYDNTEGDDPLPSSIWLVDSLDRQECKEKEQ